MFNHHLKLVFILGLSLYTLGNTLLCEVYHYFNIEIEWYYALLTIFLVTLLTWEGNRILEHLLKRKIPPEKNKFNFFSAFFLGGNIIGFLAAVLAVTFVGMILHNYSWKQNLNPLKLNIIYAVLINLFFHLLNAIFFFFREYRRQWLEAEDLRRASIKAQLQAVKNQINPHFLFNNLNVLSGMVIKDNPEANQFIEEFSKVYRHILNTQEKELIDLRSELEFVEPYLFLLRKRFDSGLAVQVDIPEHYKSYQIVPAALQLLIENAIKHNIVSSSRPLSIDIHITDNETLIVKNNLQLRSTAPSSSQIGLRNIQQRYNLISGRQVIVLKTEESFEVTLPLLTLN